jgi:hypothetical protein
MNAQVGDMVELEIKQVIRPSRDAWNDPEVWPGADKEPLLLDEAPKTDFDEEGWQW